MRVQRWLEDRQRGGDSLFGHGTDHMRVYRRGRPNSLLAFGNRFGVACGVIQQADIWGIRNVWSR